MFLISENILFLLFLPLSKFYSFLVPAFNKNNVFLVPEYGPST